MRHVFRTRSVQPDYSPGMILAAILLVIVIALDWLTWWVLIILVLLPAVINQLLLKIPKQQEHSLDEEL